MQEPVPGIQAIPDEQNARYFHVVVAGPEGVTNKQSLLFITFVQCFPQACNTCRQ